MFNTISWQAYWITLALTLAGYYAVVYLLYFRKDFKMLLPNHRGEVNPMQIDRSGNISDHSSAQTELFDRGSVDQFTRPEAGTEEYIVYSCMDEVNAFFEEAKRKGWDKEELLFALRSIFQKYPSLSTSVYKESINNVIRSESEHHCSVHLSAEDLVHVWVGR